MIAGENYGTPDLDCCLLVTPEVRETFVKALYCVISLLPAIAISLLPYYMYVANACPATGVVGGRLQDFSRVYDRPQYPEYGDVESPPVSCHQ